MFDLLRNFALKALGLVAPVVLAWFYTSEKIAADIKIRVRGEGDGVTYEGGELPKVRIWLVVSNFSPFEVEIDRLIIQLVYGTVINEIPYIRTHSIPASKEIEFLVETSLNESQFAYIKRNLEQKFETKLNLTAILRCKLHDFESTRPVNTNNVRFVNFAL